jgi:hypothetical protein
MTLAPPGERSAAETFPSDAKAMILGAPHHPVGNYRGVRAPHRFLSSISLGEKNFFY